MLPSPYRSTLIERLGPLEENYRGTLQQTLREYISSFPGWNIFITQTYAREMPRSRADVALVSLATYLQKRYRRCKGFLGAELHRSGSVHIHGLIGAAPIINRTRLWEALHRRYGFARVVPVRSQADVAAYCTKYVTKSLVEWLIL